MRKWLLVVTAFSLLISTHLYSAESASSKQALAKKLVAKFDSLNDKERKSLLALGDHAFVELLPVVRKRMTEYETQPNSGDKSFKIYERFSHAAEALHSVAAKKHTTELIELVRQAKVPDTRNIALRTLSSKGDVARTLPIFLDILKQCRPDEVGQDNAIYIALDVVAASSDPRAVEFMLQQLNDPKALSEFRHSAYLTLCRTGGTAGLRAVVAARDVNRKMVQLDQAMHLDSVGLEPFRPKEGEFVWKWETPTKLMDMQMDAAGTKWGLISSLVLGSDDDAWIARHDGTKWVALTYAGTGLGELSKTRWVSKCDDTAITQDSDGDGWTDLVEKRIGTSTTNVDTDGDGLKDAEDKNPLAVPRKLSEGETVLAAAFEARFHFPGGRGVPAIVEFPKGIQPFELTGWDGIVISVRSGQRVPAADLYGQGIATIGFVNPTRSDGSGDRDKKNDGSVIQWNKTRTEAKVVLSTYYGGLDGTGFLMTLKKFGDQWVVVDMRMEWIS